MRSRLGTDLNDLLSIEAIRPDSSDKNVCLFREVQKLLFIIGVRELNACSLIVSTKGTATRNTSKARSSDAHTWSLPVGIQLFALFGYSLELIGRATSESPFQIGWKARDDMFGCQLASVAYSMGVSHLSPW